MELREDEVMDEDIDSLNYLSINELRFRLGIVSKVIREAQRDGDSRWENVVPQQRKINAVLVRKIKRQHRANGTEPEPVRVGMQPARVVAKGMSPWD
jgi:hypothetical protein